MTRNLGVWAPYEPTAADPWNLAKVAHLHRRAGFGATWAELQRDLQAGPAASVDRLLRPPPDSQEQATLEVLRRGVLGSQDEVRLKAWWLYRILYTADRLREKLTLFWHHHFATSNRKVENVRLMLGQNEFLRRHALGDFAALLTGIVGDPAMLVWLDGADSKKEKPNENFAREFLELFTLGIGHYTEADVRAAARAFTGWVRQDKDSDESPYRFDPAGFDDGPKTFLKQTGAWKAADIVRIVLEQPAAAEFLCRKLYRFFIRENAEPEPEMLRPLAAEMRRGYSIRHVVEIMLRSQHFYDRAVVRQRIKSPVEFTVGLVRALEVPRGNVPTAALALACERQGQNLFFPPNVKGWEGGRSWLNSTTLLQRGNWIADVVWGNPDFGLKPYDPLAWAERYRVAPANAGETLLALLLQDGPDEQARDLILGPGRAGQADGLRKTLQRIVHCPEYQLA